MTNKITKTVKDFRKLLDILEGWSNELTVADLHTLAEMKEDVERMDYVFTDVVARMNDIKALSNEINEKQELESARDKLNGN